MNQGQARVSSKTSLPPRFPATPEVRAGRLFVQSGHPAEAAPSCQQAKILILNFSMKPIAIFFWLRAARVLGQGYGNEMSKQPVYELRLLSCFHASPPAGWYFSDCNSP